MAAVNDITSRDESYLAQTTLKNDLLTNRIPNVPHNHIYESADDEHIHHLNNQINSVPLHLTQMENQHTPTTSSTMSHQYSSSSMKVNVVGGENEFVDINDMNFMEHRRDIDHENLLVRRSQRKIKKDEECECLVNF